MIISNFKKIKSLIDKSELLIFDFDGVLANSVEVKTRAFALLYKPYGEKVVEKVLEHHTANEGISRFDKISYYHLFNWGLVLSSCIPLDFRNCLYREIPSSPNRLTNTRISSCSF